MYIIYAKKYTILNFICVWNSSSLLFSLLQFSCTNCPNIDSVWKKLAEKLQDVKEQIEVAQVDCEEEKGLCKGQNKS